MLPRCYMLRVKNQVHRLRVWKSSAKGVWEGLPFGSGRELSLSKLVMAGLPHRTFLHSREGSHIFLSSVLVGLLQLRVLVQLLPQRFQKCQKQRTESMITQPHTAFQNDSSLKEEPPRKSAIQRNFFAFLFTMNQNIYIYQGKVILCIVERGHQANNYNVLELLRFQGLSCHV